MKLDADALGWHEGFSTGVCPHSATNSASASGGGCGRDDPGQREPDYHER
jgi:hypothetical protein